MNSKRRSEQAAHRAMTDLCAGEDCLVCGRTGCSPCHWPTHRGIGGGKAGWTTDDIVPLCGHHHDVLDHRNGASRDKWLESDIVNAIVKEKAPAWRKQFHDDRMAPEESC